MYLKQIVEKTRANSLVTLQKREAQYHVDGIADPVLRERYLKLFSKGPHGYLVGHPQLPNSKANLTLATFTSKPGSKLKEKCVSFKDNFCKAKYISFAEMPKTDFPNIGGQDYCSLLPKPYFDDPIQKPMSAALEKLWENNSDIFIKSFNDDGTASYKSVKARTVLDRHFIKNTYSGNRDSHLLADSEIDKARAYIKEKGKQGDLELKVKPEDSPMPGDDNF